MVKSIKVNCKVVEITDSLYTALQHIRLLGQDRVLWVDAMCINRTDDLERGQQVRRMGEVYR